MRINILTKLLAMMLFLTIIPLAIVGLTSLRDARTLGNDAVSEARTMGETALANAKDMGDAALANAKDMGDNAVEDATKSLNSLGEKMILEKARDTALATQIYLEARDLTIEEMQNDPRLKEIVNSRVGETGYSLMTECDPVAKTLIMRMHVAPSMKNVDITTLKDKLPGMWAIVDPEFGCIEKVGYYDWLEPDNVTIRQKYMANTPVKGTKYIIASTTYIDEFSRPAEITRQNIEESIAISAGNIQKSMDDTESEIKFSIDATEREIQTATEGMSTKNTILFVTLATIAIVVVISFMFAKAITDPIKQLKDVSDKVVAGDFSAQMPKVHTKDEIMDLTAAMEMLVSGFKAMKESKPKVK